MSEEQTYNTPLSQQIESALEHYEDLATKGHHWNSLVVAAIKSYNPSKDQQIKDLTELLDAQGWFVGRLRTEFNYKRYQHYRQLLKSYQQKYPKP